MKIALVVHFFPPKYLSGTEIATLNIAKNLVKRGHEVHVITWLDAGFPKKSMQDGFYVHRVFGKNIRFFSPVLFWIKILLCLRSIHPDIIHIQNIRLGIPGYLSKKLFKIPYVIYARGSENIHHLSSISSYILRLTLLNANKVLVLTQDMKNDIKSFYKGDILVIPNGIELDKFENFSTDYLRTEQKKSIIFIGRFVPIKGLEYLIKAMDVIQKENENIYLTLVGDGNQRNFLEDMVKKLHLGKKVIFKGIIENTQVPKYLIQSDVFVLPSLSEGFPNVILEAMAAGLPIVTTNVGGLAEIIKNGENGYVVEPKNPDQLARKLLDILQNNDLRSLMSRNNIDKAKQYSWESIVSDLESVYSNVVKKI
jgi:glycosyltransferase involved in cell wall biosynthesis